VGRLLLFACSRHCTHRRMHELLDAPRRRSQTCSNSILAYPALCAGLRPPHAIQVCRPPGRRVGEARRRRIPAVTIVHAQRIAAGVPLMCAAALAHGLSQIVR